MCYSLKPDYSNSRRLGVFVADAMFVLVLSKTYCKMPALLFSRKILVEETVTLVTAATCAKNYSTHK